MNRKTLLPLLLAFSIAWFSHISMAQTVIYDDSDGPFTILAPVVTVLSPNGGESCNGGEAHNITWTLASSITNVNIDYSIDNGGNWAPVAASIANSGSHAWTVPMTPSTACLVRVSDAANAAVFDVSDAVFSITVPAGLVLTSPNGGENWTGGSTQTIAWNSTGAVGAIAIDYSLDNGGSWTPVATGVANGGSYAWTVPDTPSATCLVRVNDAANAAVSDVSDAVFTIRAGTTTLTVSGAVTFDGSPLAGVAMTGFPGAPLTDSSGAYSATVPYGWSGTVTPVLEPFTFTPPLHHLYRPYHRSDHLLHCVNRQPITSCHVPHGRGVVGAGQNPCHHLAEAGDSERPCPHPSVPGGIHADRDHRQQDRQRRLFRLAGAEQAEHRR